MTAEKAVRQLDTKRGTLLLSESVRWAIIMGKRKSVST